MKDTLQAGLEYQHRFTVPAGKTVPKLYPESEEFVQMPEVFATGFMVGLLEWACILAIKPHLDWPQEQSLGTHIDVSHCAATPPGLEVRVDVRLEKVDGRRLEFTVQAHDGVELISHGRHQRFIVDRSRFDAGLASKHRQAAAFQAPS